MKLTIFTPTYNRAHMLPQLFESLVNQSNRDFVWLIVDDGSTDNTRQLVEKFRETTPFKIVYVFQENAGKHAAHNTGVENCTTELFFCVDSDDFLTIDAVQKIYSIHEEFESWNILGYYFRKADTSGKVSGGAFPIHNRLIGFREIYFDLGFTGELAIVFKTDLIKNYCFPVYENEKFVTEKVLYNQLGSIAPMVYVDDVIYIFEYQETGYTKNAAKLYVKNPKGCAMGYLSDAIYGTKLVHRSKAYAAFKSMVKVFGIPVELYHNIDDVSVMVKLCAIFLKPHYNKLFDKIKKQ